MIYISVKCNSTPIKSEQIRLYGTLWLAFVVWHACYSRKDSNMKGSNDDDDDNFRRPLEPGPSFKLHGGKRRGSGRKRKHEEGYDKARTVIWRTISLHKDVYDEWIDLRSSSNIKDNSEFARYLLQCVKDSTGQPELSNVLDRTKQPGGGDERERYFVYFCCWSFA